jgi:exopolysaccharide production protein ExoQ
LSAFPDNLVVLPPRPVSRTTPLMGETREDRITFLLSVALILVFSQVWMKPLNGSATEPADSGLIRALYYPGYVLGLALVARAPWAAFRAAVRSPLLWALVAYAFISDIWSIDGSATLRRAVALGLTSAAAMSVAARASWATLTRILATAFTLIGLGSFAAGLLLPSYGRMTTLFPGAWSGLFIEKNGLGAIEAQAALFCAAAVFVDPARRRLWAAAAGLAVLLVLLSTSKTSLVAMTLGMAGLGFAVLVRRGPVTAVLATFFGVVGAGAIAAAVWLMPDTLLGLLGKDATLTGRTVIWAAVERQIDSRPMTGFGYGAVWSDQSGWGPAYWVAKQAGFRPAYAHDGWLDIWLGLGIWAVWLWAAYAAVTWVTTLWATYRQRDAYLALGFMLLYSLTCLTESVAVAYNDIGWVLFVIVAVKLTLPDRPALRAA